MLREYLLKNNKVMSIRHWAVFICRLFDRLAASPSLCGLFAVGLCLLFAFALFKPCYLTNDDAIMKGLVSGTHFYGVGPTEFTLYTSTILGSALKFLYIRMPQINWYDAYLYATLSCAVFFIVKTLAEDMRQKSGAYKTLVLLVLPLLCGVSFVGVQFTMVAGLITVSGIVVLRSLFEDAPQKLSAYFTRSFYFVFAVSLGVMIRDQSALGVGLLGCFFLLPFVPWRNLKKMLCLFGIGLAALGAVLALMLANHIMIEANPEWKYRKEVNRLYGNLTLHSIFINQKAWNIATSDLLDLSDVPDVEWSKQYQELLLSWAPIGELAVFNPENMAKVHEHLESDISLSRQRTIGFRLFQPIPSERIIHHILLLASLLLVFREKKVLGVAAYQAGCFVLIVTALSFQYRELPYRVWYSYSVLFFSFLAAYVGSRQKQRERGEALPVSMPLSSGSLLGAALIFITVLAGYNVLYWQQRHGRMSNKIYQQIKSDLILAKLNTDNDIYIVHGATLYYATLPCKPNLLEVVGLKKTIILTSTMFTRDFQRQLEIFGLPENGTIKKLVEHPDVRLLVAPKYWPSVFFLPSGTPFPALSDFMEVRYGQEIGMVETSPLVTKCLAVFQLSALSAQEKDLRRQLQDLDESELGVVPPEHSHFFTSAREALMDRYVKEYKGEDLSRSLAKVLSGLGRRISVGAQT